MKWAQNLFMHQLKDHNQKYFSMEERTPGPSKNLTLGTINKNDRNSPHLNANKIYISLGESPPGPINKSTSGNINKIHHLTPNTSLRLKKRTVPNQLESVLEGDEPTDTANNTAGDSQWGSRAQFASQLIGQLRTPANDKESVQPKETAVEVAPPDLRTHRQTGHVTPNTSQASEGLEEPDSERENNSQLEELESEPENNTEQNNEQATMGESFRMDQQQLAVLLQAVIQGLQWADGEATPYWGDNTRRDAGGGKSKNTNQDRTIKAWRRQIHRT